MRQRHIYEHVKLWLLIIYTHKPLFGVIYITLAIVFMTLEANLYVQASGMYFAGCIPAELIDRGVVWSGSSQYPSFHLPIANAGLLLMLAFFFFFFFVMNRTFISTREVKKIFSFVASPLMKYIYIFSSLDEIKIIFMTKIWIASIYLEYCLMNKPHSLNMGNTKIGLMKYIWVTDL